MQYFEQLGLCREPFSNSPDPDFLFYSKQHIACLQGLEIAVRLRRGLNVVIGDVGTGKTTLIRRFIKNLSSDSSVRLHLVLDPYFKTPHSFLRMLCAQVLGEMPDRRLNTFSLKELLKKKLYWRGIQQELTSVLIVDEGQKMTLECLEVLRELLNYETNSKKLLQILIFGQRELEPIIESMENFKDRINCYTILVPLGRQETRAMIEYRLELSTNPGETTPKLFSLAAYWAIHRASRGYPRKTVRLCHKLILNLLIRRKKRAGLRLVHSVAREEVQQGWCPGPLVLATSCIALLILIGLGGVRYVPKVRSFVNGIESAVASSFSTTQGCLDESLVPAVEVIAAARAEIVEEKVAVSSEEITLDQFFAKEVKAPATPVIIARADVAAQTLGLGALPLANEVAILPPLEKDANPSFEPAEDGSFYQLPELLGSVPVMPLEKLSVMVRKIYGVFDRINMSRVLAANPGVTNANDLVVGQTVRFPVLKPGKHGLDPSLFWLRLAVERDLAVAYGRLRAASHFGIEARILPYVAADGVLAFAMVLERPFETADDAFAARDSLPLALRGNAKAISSPSADVSLGQMNDLARGVLQAMFEQ